MLLNNLLENNNLKNC